MFSYFQEERWKESVAATNWQEKVDGRFKTISASLALKKPDQYV